VNMLDPSTERAARAFVNAIEKLPPVVGAVMYGSRARGDHKPDSDADFAILLLGPQGSTVNTILDMIDAAYAVELESGIFVSPLPIWPDQPRIPRWFR